MRAEVAGTIFAHGRIATELVETLFTTSDSLADDNQILRPDIPALGVDAACLSIIGQLGQSRGMLVFFSREELRAVPRDRRKATAAKSDPE